MVEIEAVPLYSKDDINAFLQFGIEYFDSFKSRNDGHDVATGWFLHRLLLAFNRS